MFFKHYIITRLLINFRRKKQNQDYLDFRAKIFNKFYVKSMINQTNQNFENIFLIDSNYKNLDYSKFNFDKLNCRIVVRGEDPIIDSKAKYDYILTTRMDSDDIISNVFVDTVQKKFLDVKSECIIDFSKILFLDSEKKEYSVRKYKYTSMFLTTAFEPKNFLDKNCNSRTHGSMHREFQSKICIDDIGAACICHGKNYSNTVRGGNRKIVVDIKKHFSWI